MSDDFRVVEAGDSALLVEFAEVIDPGINQRVVAVADAIRRAQVSGVRDVVPTYRSVAVYFDPLRTDYDELIRSIEREAGRATRRATDAADPLRVPVCYGGECGPDLAALAMSAGLDESDVVRLHSERTYQVFMLGFVPGFAYMGTVDDRIAARRLRTPRLRVPAGSVGIAGIQTGIYPAQTPGGWQLVGRTPLRPFDPERSTPFMFKPGDAVRFYAIERDEYERLQEWR